jgi:tetratricopeptide (TPR) repeat protein
MKPAFTDIFRPRSGASAIMHVAMLQVIAAVIAVVVLPATAFGQEDVQTSVQPRSAEIGGYVNYRLTIHVDGNRPIQVMDAPDFGDAFQITRSTKSPGYVVRNGHAMRRLTHIYQLRAIEEGQHSIGPPTIEVAGKTVEADPVTVRIHPRGRAPKSRSGASGRHRQNNQSPDDSQDKRIFVDHALDPTTTPYVGQQVTLAYYLYADAFRLKVNPDPPDEPSLDAFWIEDLSEEFSGRRRTLRINGETMERANLRAYALFPLRAGTSHIEPLEVDVRIGGFMRRTQRKHLASDPIELDVKALPPNAPDSFYQGNVGQWRFQVTTDQTRAAMGRPITIRVSASGDGQIGRISLPELPTIDGARRAGTQENLDKRIRSGVIGGDKTIEYTLVAEREGTLEIPSLTFSYFDPKAETYETIETEAIPIEIKGGTLALEHQEAPDARPDGPREEAAVLDTLVSKLDGPRSRVSPQPAAPLERSPLWWILLAIPALGVSLVWLAEPVRAFVATATTKRRGNSYKKALAELAAAKELPPAKTLDRVRDALTIYVTGNAGVAAGAVSEAALPVHLEERGVDPALARRLGDLLCGLNEARFSPDKDAMAAQASELRDECEACLKALEEGRRAKHWTASTAAAVLLAVAITAAGSLAPAPAYADNDLPAKTLEKAVQAQENSQWQDAATLWKQLDEVRPDSADILYNLGTSLAHTGHYGQARLAFERASLHAPGDDQIAKNRDLVQQIVHLRQIELARGTMRENTTSEGLFWWRLATGISPHWLLVVLTVMAWLVLFASLARKFSKNTAARDAGLVVAVVCTVLMVITLGVWIARGQVLADVQPAVIVAQESPLREGPSEHAGLADIDTILVPGVLLPVRDTRDGWVKLGFADGTTAWTPRENVALVE